MSLSIDNASDIAKNLKSLLQRNHSTLSEASRLDELRRLFGRLVANGQLHWSSNNNNNNNNNNKNNSSSKQESSSSNKSTLEEWNEWLCRCHDKFIIQLVNEIQSGHRNKVTSLRTFLGVVASSPLLTTTKRKNPNITICRREIIHPKLMTAVLESLCRPTTTTTTTKSKSKSSSKIGYAQEYLLCMFSKEFVNAHVDARYATMKSIITMANHIYSQIKNNNNNNNTKDDDDYDDYELVSENLIRILIKIQIQETTNQDLWSSSFLLSSSIEMASQLRQHNHDIDDNSETGDKDADDEDTDDEKEEENSDDDDDDDDESFDSSNGQAKKTTTTKQATKKTIQKQKIPALLQIRCHYRLLQDCWFSVFKIPILSQRILRASLRHLPEFVLPLVPSPLRFAEVFIRAYDNDDYTTNISHNNNNDENDDDDDDDDEKDKINNNKTTKKEQQQFKTEEQQQQGGNNGRLTSILALHGLFDLMMSPKSSLEYPNFYPRLYSILDISVFHSKHRTRFFRLLVSCLYGSQMLPAYLVAAFCKRLLRRSILAPPSGCLFVLALVSNLLRKHEECACLIHRRGSEDDGEMDDPYDAETNDPAQCRAMESSLWELSALGRHYHPAISSLAKSIGTEQKTPLQYSMEDFMNHTYKSLFEQERKRAPLACTVVEEEENMTTSQEQEQQQRNKRRRKIMVPVTFQEPSSLFVKGDVFENVLIVPKQTK